MRVQINQKTAQRKTTSGLLSPSWKHTVPIWINLRESQTIEKTRPPRREPSWKMTSGLLQPKCQTTGIDWVIQKQSIIRVIHTQSIIHRDNTRRVSDVTNSSLVSWSSCFRRSTSWLIVESWFSELFPVCGAWFCDEFRLFDGIPSLSRVSNGRKRLVYLRTVALHR